MMVPICGELSLMVMLLMAEPQKTLSYHFIIANASLF